MNFFNSNSRNVLFSDVRGAIRAKHSQANADQLVEHDVPKEDIVLAYHAPHVRQYTDFAVG